MSTESFLRRGRLVPLAALLLGCGAAAPAGPGARTADAESPGAAGATPEAAGGDQPLDLKALMAREVTDLKATPAQAEFVKAQVLASGATTASAEKAAAKLEIPIGTQAKVTCLAYRQDPDAGAMLAAILNGLKKLGEVQEIRVLPVEVVKEAPVVSVAALYVVKSPKGNMVGELKLMFHSRIDHSSLCFHDEVGYRESFARVARSFFESQDRGLPASPSSFVEIQLGHVNSMPAGFDKVEIFRDQAGNRKVISLGLVFLLRSPTEPIALDSATVTTVDAKGVILDGHFLRFENGRSTLDLKLTRKAGSNYDFSGTSQGKPISGSFRAKDKDGLPSGLRVEKRIADGLRGGRAFSFKSESYDPDSDPTKTKLVEYKHGEKDPARLIKVKLDQSEVSGTADELGRMQEGKLQLGPLTIEMKRALLRGSP